MTPPELRQLFRDLFNRNPPQGLNLKIFFKQIKKGRTVSFDTTKKQKLRKNP